ncbi:thiamine pyrophosphate-dependent dehydrogenase E1 component subunit alpha [Sulfuriroseicoccus oceanibius]|uniref:Thiamine pyrophosphate-dependent dehydrogenase E1 component subunit alpha n=2 Tax=Sulfuriroseicoccus oceanibius TaxID=2707525 RepID=A0A6B3LCP2_9BACT|nr:thiamine pyrophosphate-dependent dehydrogenase E1 component subunit alpha [Sulfuriroseicoccus oceanibius]
MLFARRLEERIASLYRAGKIVGGVYLGRGQEAVSASLGYALKRSLGDVFAPLIRDQAGRVAFGEDPLDFARTYLGSVKGPMRGRDGNIHRGRPSEGMPAMISHLGASVSVINGMLFAKRLRGDSGFVGGATSGEGATSTGAFHEGLNQAAVENLPLVVVVTDNQFAYSTPNARQFACDSLVDRAEGYGVAGHTCVGNDLKECVDTICEAVDNARRGQGPQLVVAQSLRLCGHGEHDDAFYVPDEIRETELGQDCIDTGRDFLISRSLATAEELDAMDEELRSRVREVMATAQRDPQPDPFRDDWRTFSQL